MRRFQERHRVIVAAEQFRRDVKPWPDGVKLANRDTEDELPTIMALPDDRRGSVHELYVLRDTDWIVRRDDGSTVVYGDLLFREKYDAVL